VLGDEVRYGRGRVVRVGSAIGRCVDEVGYAVSEGGVDESFAVRFFVVAEGDLGVVRSCSVSWVVVISRTCTLKTPQIGLLVAAFAWRNMSSIALKSPVMSLMFGDLCRSFCADADWAFRVTARISNGELASRSAFTTDPPCLPVAPVMRSAREAIMRVCL
jgi:hypothetical protein